MHGMLTREQYRCIQEKAPSKQTDDILIAISTTQKNFSKFLKILHSDERGLYADMLKDLDTILTAEGMYWYLMKEIESVCMYFRSIAGMLYFSVFTPSLLFV